MKFDPHTGSEAELEPYSLYPARSSRDPRLKAHSAVHLRLEVGQSEWCLNVWTGESEVAARAISYIIKIISGEIIFMSQAVKIMATAKGYYITSVGSFAFFLKTRVGNLCLTYLMQVL
jgi:hypothetical protein